MFTLLILSSGGKVLLARGYFLRRREGGIARRETEGSERKGREEDAERKRGKGKERKVGGCGGKRSTLSRHVLAAAFVIAFFWGVSYSPPGQDWGGGRRECQLGVG